ncbi:hypothetical protein UF75_2129 [Desulfosporosinus sp. I2]|nr:hypothetical protein UF75_2129 [Desulfosporosinus sp. I2]
MALNLLIRSTSFIGLINKKRSRFSYILYHCNLGRVQRPLVL